jgi:hypothetical protein
VAENRTHNNVHEVTAVARMSLALDPKGNLTRDNNGLQYD